MEERNFFDPDGFERVWQRVSSGAPTPPPQPRTCDADALRSFIEGEAASAAYYTALAARSCGAARRLMQLAADEREHQRRLQVEYFLLAGDTLSPSLSCPVQGGVLDDLRRAYLGELDAADCYRQAAAAADGAALRALYAALAVEETGHAAVLRRLVAAAMG